MLALGACAGGKQNSESQGGQKETGVQTEEMSEARDSVYHKITAEEAKEMMEQGGVTIVDVRREDEYTQGHIPGALLLPNEEIGDSQPEALPDKDAVLLVYCRTGVRSRQASDKLLKLGYKNIYDMGGITDWQYETETGSKSAE